MDSAGGSTDPVDVRPVYEELGPVVFLGLVDSSLGMVRYRPRHLGPGISAANFSCRLHAPDLAIITDRHARCWDEMCDDDRALAGWIDAHIRDLGFTMWKYVDQPGVTKLRRGKHDIVVTLDAELLRGADADGFIKDLTLETLAQRAIKDDIEPPPGWPRPPLTS